MDFNVPLNEQDEITDDLRIRTVFPTIQYALDQGAKVILASHRGRPKGQRVKKYSLAPVAEYLSGILDKPVRMADDCVGPEVESTVAAMNNGDILLLENLRFHAEEQANDPAFSQQLAALTDVYINDAFAVSHRAHASVDGVTAHVQEKAAGLLLDKEMSYFHRSVDNPQRPLVAIVGGAKVSGKLEALTNMLNKVDCLLIGGAMANTFLKSQGYSVGASKVEDDLLDNARQLLVDAKEKDVKVYLPVDVIAADRFAPDAVCRQVTIQDIPDNWMALDIGPATVICFSEVLADAKTDRVRDAAQATLDALRQREGEMLPLLVRLRDMARDGRMVRLPGGEAMLGAHVIAHHGTTSQRERARAMLDRLAAGEDPMTAPFAAWSRDTEPRGRRIRFDESRPIESGGSSSSKISSAACRYFTTRSPGRWTIRASP